MDGELLLEWLGKLESWQVNMEVELGKLQEMDIQRRLNRLESAASPPPTAALSSAPTTGTAAKPSESFTASLRDDGPWSVAATGAASKYPPFTAPEWAAYLKVSSILRSMFELHMTSGENKAGDPGPVSRE